MKSNDSHLSSQAKKIIPREKLERFRPRNVVAFSIAESVVSTVRCGSEFNCSYLRTYLVRIDKLFVINLKISIAWR